MSIIHEYITKNLASSNLHDIFEKVAHNQRLSKEDGLRLYESSELLSIGYMANLARINRLKQDNEAANYVYWINNHHLNLTNICEGKCKFCAYRKQESDNDAFLLSLDQAIEYIETKIDKNIKEIHIVSALNPKCDLDYYINLLKNCRRILPNTHIQAFTAVEIEYIARISGLTIEQTLKELKDAGLGSLPGGGAEIFSPSIRERVCPEKISGEKWLEIMQLAHSLGIKSNATMLSGIGESYEDKIEHMIALRETQDKTGGFMTFIPLFCHYENTELDNYDDITGIDIIKDYAISRLMLDNIPHIKAFWIQIGIKLAQITLSFGVDDLDGTVIEEKITHSAGARTGQALSKNELIHLIKKTGKTPVERDTVYNIIKVY
ncbi:MAG: aminofutalosine synthase MqnE [Candidatus Melainabacteria bacterium RIFOXYA12_FULL_32_12]|nr:MAG: aminofutalosine synthase MqnE [Candidatus Melainabacteria bacterium RIFOXYA2_FULL_32_9]OGI27486.1 MAG: aminofutalosine synthase MqnE [Candidatus Melainabacteria bacterium RIFOXYA12_FULL_32_12]